MLIAIIAYFVLVFVVGFVFSKKNDTLSYYLLGGRSNNVWVTALSAQASDMSSWLLMGLPGAIYLTGGSGAWIAIGLALGTYINWLFVAKRLRKYSYIANDSLTLPEFFENRFKDKRGLICVISGIVVFVFITFYLSSGLTAGGQLFSVIFPAMDYNLAVFISLAIVVIYTLMGGFKAVCWTDLFQGLLMIVAIVAVPLTAFGMIDQVKGAENLAAMGEGFLNIFQEVSGEPINGWTVVNGLVWGLGYLGMPYILVRFMAAKDARSIKTSRRIAMVWVVLSLAAACFVGIVGRMYFGDSLGAANETVFIALTMQTCAPILAGVLLSAILAAMMSTADSQLICVASAFTNDIFSRVFKKKLSDKAGVWVSRACIVVVAAIAFLLALDPENNTIMSMVEYAWSGLGAAFGPVVLLCLFWKRMTLSGAIAGMVTGFATVVIWNSFLSFTGVYQLLPGFVLGTAAIIIVSLLSKPPCKEITDDFEKMLESE